MASIIEAPEGKPEHDVITLIRSDLFRHAGRTSASALFHHLLCNRSFRYCFWLRACRSPWTIVRVIAKLMHRYLSNKYGIQIPARTRIGPGLYIGHHMGIIVNWTATIGSNCNIGQFTTIGSNHDNAARIGDRVYIGPGTSIVEGVTIGDNATIGAGSIVVKDVPADATVAGNPARVISWKAPARYVQNPWRG
ncbi:serine O-acetyltransferase [Marilutibacter chinensis]|uniref:Serine O-acetyltransferase n=1 Tax=Marilutibacter chinensis TaxID=2912247 RepID=A0ABS9HRY3_9GAMM|nr:serine O-acetyltransferase [Lysobacter chinensis]MCF7220954.1 serine O-acetyltransferase [Lysobacter chinensis]